MDYAIESWTLATDSGWNNLALNDAFLHSLSSKIKDQVIALEIPEDLDGVIAVANKIDRRLQDREREKADYSFKPLLGKNTRPPFFLNLTAFQLNLCS